MIHLFNGVRDIVNLPCRACGECTKLFCQIDCRPCQDLFNRPLGSYVVLAILLGGAEVFLTIRSLLHKERLAGCDFPSNYYGTEIGVVNWLYAQSGLAWLHLVFAPYIQSQVVRKLTQYQDGDPGAPAAGMGPSRADRVREAVLEVVKYDFGVLLYVLTLCFSLGWSLLGWDWILTNELACNPEGYPLNAALMGIVTFWAVVLYSLTWWCCTNAAAGLSHDLRAARGMRQPSQQQQQFRRAGSNMGRYQHVPQHYQNQRAFADAYQYPGPPPLRGHDCTVYACAQAERGEPLKPCYRSPEEPYLNVEDNMAFVPSPQNAYGSPYASGCARMCRPGQLLKLCACLALDLCGDASYMVPELGDGTDLAFAPAQAMALKVLFNSKFVAFAGLAEELMPGTDFIPTATIAWFLETFAPEHWLTAALGIEAVPDYPVYPTAQQWGPGLKY